MCANHPGFGKTRQLGRCHICKREKSIGFCPVCCHWFCDSCRPNVFKRGAAAVKHWFKPKPNCCGPTEGVAA